MKAVVSIIFAMLLALTSFAGTAEEAPHALVVYYDYSENMGDLTGMTVDLVQFRHNTIDAEGLIPQLTGFHD